MIYKYKGSRVMASSRKEAIHKIVAGISIETEDFFEAMDYEFADYKGGYSDHAKEINGLNKEFLTEILLDYIQNTEKLAEEIPNNRKKAHSLVWEALYSYIKENGIVNRGFNLTGDKIKNWFKHVKTDYINGLSDAVKEVQKLKDEANKNKGKKVTSSADYTLKMYFDKAFKEWRPVAVINDGSNTIVDWDRGAFGKIKWYATEADKSYINSMKPLDLNKVKPFTSKENHSIDSLKKFVENYIH